MLWGTVGICEPGEEINVHCVSVCQVVNCGINRWIIVSLSEEEIPTMIIKLPIVKERWACVRFDHIICCCGSC